MIQSPQHRRPTRWLDVSTQAETVGLQTAPRCAAPRTAPKFVRRLPLSGLQKTLRLATGLAAASVLTGCGGLHWPLFPRARVIERPAVVSRFNPSPAASGAVPPLVEVAISNDAKKITPPMLEQFATRLSAEMQLSVPGVVVDRVLPAGYSHEWPSDDVAIASPAADRIPAELPAPGGEPGIILPPPGAVIPAEGVEQRQQLEISVVDFRPYQPMRMSLRLVLYQEPGHLEVASANAIWEAVPDEHHPVGPWRERLRQRLFDRSRDPVRHLQAISPNEFFRRVSQEVAMWYASSGAQPPLIAADPNGAAIESSWSVPGVPGPLP